MAGDIPVGRQFGVWPRHLRDELLYSILARYQRMLGGAEAPIASVLSLAFGFEQKRFRRVQVLAPIRLNHLARARRDLTAETLIRNHTIMPLLSRFMRS